MPLHVPRGYGPAENAPLVGILVSIIAPTKTRSTGLFTAILDLEMGLMQWTCIYKLRTYIYYEQDGGSGRF